MKPPKVGDYITFTCVTIGSGKRKVRRKVTDMSMFESNGYIGVRYDGWNPFWIVKKLGDKIHKTERTNGSR